MGDIRLVAGIDVAYDKHSDRLIAAVVVLDALSLIIIEHVTYEDRSQFPYILGLFSFRELPPVEVALSQIKTSPDLIICDGQGVAHPRRFGLAAHIGVLFDVPKIGCGKTRLLGVHERVGSLRGDSSPLVDAGETVGCVLRTQSNVNPLYISAGHRISLHTACTWTLHLCKKYRLPEAIRVADHLVRKLLRSDVPSTPSPLRQQSKIGRVR